MAKSPTKIVSKSSDTTVLMSRVEISDNSVGEFALKSLMAGAATFLFTAGGLDIFILPSPESFGIGGIAGGVAACVGAFATHTNLIQAQLSKYTGTGFSRKSKWKAFSSMLTPFGQSIDVGKQEVSLHREITPNLIGGSYSVHSASRYHDYYDDYDEYPRKRNKGVTHSVATEVVFKPWGSYIKQTVETSPMSVWDEAFKSTVEVHSFSDEKKKALTSA